MSPAFRPDTMNSLTSRPSTQAVNQRVLHHNLELTNIVSRLTEKKIELRNKLGHLEEEIWRYRQRGAEQQDAVLGQEVEESHQSGVPRDGGHSRPPTRVIKLTVKPRLIVTRHVSLFTSYAPNSNSFSPPCINTQSHVNGSGPYNSHASSPLHSSVHQSPYSPSYLSSSFTQRDLLNGASPYHSLGGASGGYHVSSNGVINGISSYQSVGGVSDSYHVNGNFSVHITPSTRDYSSILHPLLKTRVLEEKSSPRLLPPPQKLVTHLQHVE